MRCFKVRALLSKYLDSELGEDLSAEVGKHLAKCFACRAAEAKLRRALDLLREWPETEPQFGYDALLARVNQKHVARERSVPMPKLPVPRWAAAIMAATSIAVGVALGIILPESNVPTSLPSEQQVVNAMDLHPYDVVEASLTYSLADGDQRPIEKRELQ